MASLSPSWQNQTFWHKKGIQMPNAAGQDKERRLKTSQNQPTTAHFFRKTRREQKKPTWITSGYSQYLKYKNNVQV